MPVASPPTAGPAESAGTALAVVKAGPESGVVLQRRPLPPLGERDVLLRPLATGICGSDLATYSWHERRRPVLLASMPVVMGHEVAGEVVRVGPAVRDFASGDRVVTDPLLRCGTCRLCLAGRPQICVARRQLGYHVDGGMAELAVVPATCLVHLPDEIGWIEAPLVEVLAVGVHALERAGLVAGQACAVVGPGPVGLLLAQAVRAAGASPVALLGTDRSRPRLESARAYGIDETAVLDEDWIVRNLERFEVVFEAAGTPEALLAAVRLTRRGGRVVYASGFEDPVPIRFNEMLKLREIDLYTSTGHPPSAWERSFGLVKAGAVRLDGLVDLTVPLERAAEGFAAAYARQVFKCVVVASTPA